MTLQIYSEYGIGKGWEISAVLPFVMQSSGRQSENPSLNQTTDEGHLNAFGNIQLGLKKELYKGSFILSAALGATFNTAIFQENTGLRSGYDAYGLAPSLIVGTGMDNWFAYLNTGPTFRSGGYSSEWRIQAEGGYKVYDKLFVMFNIFIVESLQDGQVMLPLSNLETGFYVNNQSFFSFGPKFLASFTENLGLSGAIYFAGSGNQIAKSPSLNLGLYYKW